MRLFSNYLVILVLMIIWPALLLLFLVFSAWLDRFAGQPPKWVLRQQAAAQAREEALRSAGDAPATGRTRYWHPPRAARGGREQPAERPLAIAPKPAPQAVCARAAVQGPAARQPGAPPRPPSTSGGPVPAGTGRSRGAPPAQPDGQRRPGAIDESTEPMAGFPVDRLPPEPPG